MSATGNAVTSSYNIVFLTIYPFQRLDFEPLILLASEFTEKKVSRFVQWNASAAIEHSAPNTSYPVD